MKGPPVRFNLFFEAGESLVCDLRLADGHLEAAVDNLIFSRVWWRLNGDRRHLTGFCTGGILLRRHEAFFFWGFWGGRCGKHGNIDGNGSTEAGDSASNEGPLGAVRTTIGVAA